LIEPTEEEALVIDISQDAAAVLNEALSLLSNQ
jgi:gluconokinase